MTELEKKLLLTEDEYDYLMEHFGYESPLNQKPIVTQINYYFDTDDLSMNRQNTTCRIRLKDGKYKATMKKHASGSDQSTETEMEIRNGLESNAITDMGLKLQGELVTNRCVVFKDKSCEAVLDKNEYLGYNDYELEIEYSSEHEKDALDILRILQGILIRRKCFLAYMESYTNPSVVPSKSSRFFSRKNLIDQITQTQKKQMDELKNNEYANKSVQNNSATPCDSKAPDYCDPDDYLWGYYGAMMPRDTSCISCVHFNGNACDIFDQSCEYKHF